MRCLGDEEILDLAEGRRAFDAHVQAHVGACASCRQLFAAVARGAGATLRDTPQGDGIEPSWDELGQGVVVASRYELDAFLGAGGMGVVWSARRIDDGQRVALKIARSHEEELCRRFAREADVARSLSHPNVVRIFEVLPATSTRGPGIVQELLVGETLEARLARGPSLSLSDAARLVLPVALALEHAHARGVVHRDVKPQNVFVEERRVTVLDFGIAKLLPAWGAHSKLTRTGAVLGTPRYMAPEQLFGEEPDARADVWAVGAILMRILSGLTPFDGESLGDIMKGVQRGRVHDLGVLCPTLPADVLWLARGALVLERRARLPGVRPFVEILSRYA